MINPVWQVLVGPSKHHHNQTASTSARATRLDFVGHQREELRELNAAVCIRIHL
jgi:hypothetical protein